ncbi:hypothetical protein PoB_004928800 [Plakobranchus ocellatus]|uniref:Uncharacterized protein n=1 Tax=Plakobranchus ocellatus TaxID=259542 RepID=A0AAV4BVE6_9GAST|nr:hypothetical protein PoB_004928800 [Plakobranchus ocellatus]
MFSSSNRGFVILTLEKLCRCSLHPTDDVLFIYQRVCNLDSGETVQMFSSSNRGFAILTLEKLQMFSLSNRGFVILTLEKLCR